jgi:hypothetical protein
MAAAVAIPSFLATGCGRKVPAPNLTQGPKELPALSALSGEPISRSELERFAGSASRFATGGVAEDPSLHARFNTQADHGRCTLVARHGDRRAVVAAEYGFGSGNRGITYLGQYGETTVELRLSYYRSLGRWGFSPNQPVGSRTESPVGRVVGSAEKEECFSCHSTAVVREKGAIQPQISLLGIGCEGCHGPGKPHIQAVKAGATDLKMEKLGEDAGGGSLRLCGRCHRAPAGKDPGDPIVRAQLARFQATALEQSACFIATGGKIGCTSCHDPHRNIETESTTRYNRACRSCHGEGARMTVCPTAPQGDCVSCHMPRQQLPILTRPAYSNHWIGIWHGGKMKAPLDVKRTVSLRGA